MIGKISHSKKIYIVICACIILVALFITASYVNFRSKAAAAESQQQREQLKEVAEQESASLNNLLISFQNSIKTITTLVSEFENFQSKEVLNWIRMITSAGATSDIIIANRDGKIVSASGKNYAIENESYFKRVMSGKDVISGVRRQSTDDENEFIVCSPIIRNDKVVGAIFGIYQTKSISDLLDVTSFEGTGYSHVFQVSDGRFISYSNHAVDSVIQPTNFFTLNQAKFSKGYDALSLYSDLHRGLSGITAFYENNGVLSLGYYMPTTIENWYVFTVVPGEVAGKYASLSSKLGIELIIYMTASFITLILIIAFLYYQFRNDILKRNEELRISEEGFRVAVDHIPCFFFILNPGLSQYKILKTPPDFQRIAISPTGSVEVLKNYIHPDFIPVIHETAESIRNGAKSKQQEIKARFSAQEPWRWMKTTFITIFDKNQQPVKVIGTVEDISKQKEKEAILTERAEIDQLTRVANRAGLDHWISTYEDETGSGVFNGCYILCDIDNFKRFNDTFGHMFGDLVLKTVAEALTETFSCCSGSIIGRLGGDEFAVMIKNARGRENEIKSSLQKLLIHISKTDLQKADIEELTGGMQYDAALLQPKKDVRISVTISIGVAFSSPMDTTFSCLYDMADKALYLCKGTGKNQFRIFNEEEDGENSEFGC